MEKYYNDKGKLGILISPGWGAGWSTWQDNYENEEEGEQRYAIALDKRVIEFWMNHKYDKEKPETINETYKMQDFLESIGYDHIYMGGYEQLELVFVPKGQMFCIHEYDGYETIETPESMGMIISE